MSSRQYAIAAAGFVGACGVALLTHGNALTGHAREAALTGPRAAVHAEIERREATVPAGRTRDEGLWQAHLRAVDGELAAGHIDAAVRVWHDAYGAALESRRWEGMLAVGDAFMRIGYATGAPAGARMNARDAYLVALIRARRERSVDGVLQSADAFGRLGDRVVVEQNLVIAEQLAAGDERAEQRVSEARLRWTGSQTLAGFEP